MRSWIIFIGLLLSACAQENAARESESEAVGSVAGKAIYRDEFVGRPLSELGRVAMRTSDGYKVLGDQASTRRDLTAAALIALVAYGAAGDVSGLSEGGLARVAVAGLAVNEGAKYVNPNLAAAAFYDASSEMACIGTEVFVFLGGQDSLRTVDVAASAITLNYIRKVELRLRAALRREIPDISELNEAFSVFDAGFTGGQRSLAVLKSALEQCVSSEEPSDD